jgi:hypothetical protein
MSDTVASMTHASVQSLRPDDLPTSFSLGELAGTLMATAPDTLYTAGASAFVQIRMSSQSTSKRGLSAVLQVESEQGEIVAISGDGVADEKEGSIHLARIDGIRKGRDRVVLVEVRLQSAGDQTANALRLSLQRALEEEGRIKEPAPDHPNWTAVITWPVADCGTRFQAALRGIGEAGGNALREVWRTAAQPDASIPRRWLFKPDRTRRYGREDEEESRTISAREARSIYQEAGEMTSLGYEQMLRRKGAFDWILSKTSSDLEKYFTQDSKPAICTGALEFASYYEEKLAPLEKRGDRLSSIAAKSEALARDSAAETFEAMRDLPGGHPAIGGASLEAMKPHDVQSSDLKMLVVGLLESAGLEPDSLGQARSAADIFGALEAAAGSDLDTQDLPGDARAELHDALGAIEAAARLKAYRARYEAFWTGFFGKIEAIRTAHAEHCACGSKVASQGAVPRD